MKTAAIICEYNPFHNGHKYQVEKARQLTGCDAVVALMSGNFVQRGDFSVFPKELRAKAALLNGIDLVLENPSYLTLKSAEGYAFSAVYTLNALGCIDYLVFGAENDNLDKLCEIAKLLAFETEEFKQKLAEKMSLGLQFAAARSKVAEELLGGDTVEILKQPNNLLAVEYLKALMRLNSSIKPVAIKRVGTGHNDTLPNGEYASATLIRESLVQDKNISDYIPENIMELYKEKPFDTSAADMAVISALALKTAEDFVLVPDISEGLENKIKAELFKADTIDGLVSGVKSKRYAYSRIKRALLCAYLGIDKEESGKLPEYIKILDFNREGQAVLNMAKKTTTLPLAKNASPLLKNETAMGQWKKELDRDRVYEILYSAVR